MGNSENLNHQSPEKSNANGNQFSSVIKVPSGFYLLVNTFMPENMKDQIINPERTHSVVEIVLRERGILADELKMDDTGIIQSIRGRKAYRSFGLHPGLNGEFNLVGVTDPDVAVAFLKILSLSHTKDASFIDGGVGDRNYYPRRLILPSYVLQGEDRVSTQKYQDGFRRNARTVARSYGAVFDRVDFDGRGILTYAAIQPGRACFYTLNSEDGNYWSDNVYSADEALALHLMTTTFLHDLATLKAGKGIKRR